ncbi:MAG: prepilin peptidase [Clostridia bacterium]|nr:prepilin peptidase [Clostridia bacterium]
MIGLVYFFAALIGLCVGSFLNVLIYRLPNKINIAVPGSHCPKCSYKLKWYDNIPVISYIILKGKCRNCGGKISIRYTIVEIANSLLWVACVAMFWKTSIPMACIYALSLSILLTMTCADLEYLIVPDSLQIALGVLAVATVVLSAVGIDKTVTWYSRLIGAAVFGLAFLVISVIFEKIVHHEAMGGGDIKLAFIAGGLLGWEKMLAAMLVATILGSIILLIIRKVSKSEKETQYPFVPFMALGVAAMIFFGDFVVKGYSDLIASIIR